MNHQDPQQQHIQGMHILKLALICSGKGCAIVKARKYVFFYAYPEHYLAGVDSRCTHVAARERNNFDHVSIASQK